MMEVYNLLAFFGGWSWVLCHVNEVFPSDSLLLKYYIETQTTQQLKTVHGWCIISWFN